MKLQLSGTTRVLLGLYGPAMIMSLGQGMVVPTIPSLASEFGVSAGVAAQLVTAVIVGRFFALLPTGQLIDRFGRKPVLVGCPLLVTVASVLTAVAPAFWMLLVAQFLTGFGTSAWSVAREIAAVDVVRPEQRGRMIAGFQGMTSVGTAVGPIVGGVVTQYFNFRAVFWVYALMGLFTLLVSIRLPETAAPRKAGPRRGLLNLGRVSEVEPFFRMTYVVLIFNTFVAMMRGALVQSLVPLYLGLQLARTPSEVGTWFGIYGFFNVLMIAPTGIISDKRGRKAVVIPSVFLALIVFVSFPLATEGWALLVLAALTGIFQGLSLGSMATYTYDVIPEHARARLQSLRRIIGDSGAILGPAIGGVISDAASPSLAFWAFLPLQILAGLAIIFLARETLPFVRSRTNLGPPRSS